MEQTAVRTGGFLPVSAHCGGVFAGNDLYRSSIRVTEVGK
jgi:hypothetical protein